MRIFLAGATGVVGRRLATLLSDAGHEVTGTTRISARLPMLRALGIAPIVVDVFDAGALKEAVAAARPDVVIHQLTRSEEHTSELQSQSNLVCRLLLEK